MLGSLVLVETISFHGHSLQTSDFRVRNAIYQSLIEQPWPLYDSRGGYFVYYHAFWLPPALLARYVGNVISSQTILFIWSYLHIAIAMCLLFCRTKGRILSFFVIFFMMGTIFPNLCHVLAKLSESQYPDLSAWLWKYGLDGYIGYVPFWNSLTYNFNTSLPCILCLALLFSNLLPKRYWCIPAALIVQPSLLSAAAMFVWFIATLMMTKNAFKETLASPFTWCCAAYVMLVLIYFSCMGSGDANNGVYWVWSSESFIGLSCSPLARTLRAIMLPATLIISLSWIIERRLRMNCVFVGGCLVSAIIPFVWVGMQNNELIFKGGVVLYFLFSWVLSIQWSHSDSKHKIILMLFLFLSGMHIISELRTHDFYSNYSWSENQMKKNILDPYKGSINNMDDYIRGQFLGENRHSYLLLEQSNFKCFDKQN